MLCLKRELLAELGTGDLARIRAGVATDPSCVAPLCAITGRACESTLEPCYQTSACSM